MLVDIFELLIGDTTKTIKISVAVLVLSVAFSILCWLPVEIHRATPATVEGPAPEPVVVPTFTLPEEH